MSNQNLYTKGVLKTLFTAAAVSISCSLCAPAVQAQSKKISTISFEKDKYNRIFLPAKINRDSLSILFSTYSKTLRLTPYFAEARALYPSWDRLTVTDKNGARRNRMLFYLPEIQIGKLRFYNEETTVNPAFPDSIATGSTGTLLVNQYNWRIDNDRNMMSISKSPFTPEHPYTTISYKKDSLPVAKVQIDQLSADFILDLGSGAAFQISAATELGRQLIATHHLKPKTTITSTIHTRKMVDTIYEVVVPSLLFNGVEIRNPKVILSSASSRNIIGTGFLGNYNVILNNSKKKKIESSFILEKRLMN